MVWGVSSRVHAGFCRLVRILGVLLFTKKGGLEDAGVDTSSGIPEIPGVWSIQFLECLKHETCGDLIKKNNMQLCKGFR